jgi:hypothetical protein
MTTYETTDDDFDFVATPTTDETEDGLYFVEGGVCGPQDFVGDLGPDEAKRNGSVMLPFIQLALLAIGRQLDQQPLEELMLQVLRNLNIRYAHFMDDQLTVQF